jgi:hypothetical protein
MPIESAIRDLDQIPVEPIPSNSRLVTTNQQNRPALYVERKGHPPRAATGTEAKLFHVGVLRSIQRIDLRPAKQRSEPPEQPDQ